MRIIINPIFYDFKSFYPQTLNLLFLPIFIYFSFQLKFISNACPSPSTSNILSLYFSPSIRLSYNISHVITYPTEHISPVHIDDKQLLTHICLNPNCKSDLLCHSCCDKHQNHRTMTILRLVDSAKKLWSDQTVDKRCNQLIQRKTKFLSIMCCIRQEFEISLKKAEATVLKYFDDFEKSIGMMKAKNESIQFPSVDFSNMPIQKLSEKICVLRENFLRKEQSRKIFMTFLNAYTQDVDQRIQITINTQQKILPKMSDLVNSIPAIYEKKPKAPGKQPEKPQQPEKQQQQQKSMILQLLEKIILIQKNNDWNQKLKHPDIRIDGRKISRVAITNRSNDRYQAVCCLGQNVISDKEDSQICIWSIKINIMRQWIILGMCSIAIHLLSGFEKRWPQTGHMHYCLSSDGQVYSHSDQKINMKKLSFTFKAGDTLNFLYDPSVGRLKIGKEGSDESYEMSIQKNKGEHYAVCAYLKEADTFWKYGDSVELIER